MILPDLETPAPIVDLDILEKNLDQMATFAAGVGLGLRPHIKTHKSPIIAAEQLRRGAVGLTCATTREAEVMSEVSNEILSAYPPVGGPRLARLMGLPESVRLIVGLDSVPAIEGLAAAARAAERPVRVLIECDLGMHRVGVGTVADLIELARLVRSRPPLEFAGMMFYPGHIRVPREEQGDLLRHLDQELQSWLASLRQAGFEPAIVSGGSTPTAAGAHLIRGLTEIRPGTYVFNDRETVSLGATARERCAFTVLATVVSTAVPGQAVVDAGAKALGREPLRVGTGAGFGELLERPEVVVKGMSEEHGILDLSRTDWKPRVGDQIRIIPNHVCIVTHLHDALFGSRGETVERVIPIAARGRLPAGEPST